MAFDFKKYYKEHKKEISEKRKERYAEDKRYRNRAKRQSREYWKKTHVPSDSTVIHDKKGREYLSISHVSEAINKDSNCQ